MSIDVEPPPTTLVLDRTELIRDLTVRIETLLATERMTVRGAMRHVACEVGLTQMAVHRLVRFESFSPRAPGGARDGLTR